MVQAGIFHTFNQTGDLDVDHPLAIGRNILCQCGQMRVLGEVTGQFCDNLFPAEGDGAMIVGTVKGSVLDAHIGKIIDVELRYGKRILFLFVCQDHAVFRHEAEAGEHLVGGGFTLVGRCADHTGQGAFRLILHGSFCFGTAAYGHREGCQLCNDSGSGDCMFDGRRDNGIPVSAQLYGDLHIGNILVYKEKIRHHESAISAVHDNIPNLIIRRDKVSSLYIGAGNHAQKFSVIDRCSAAVQTGLVQERKTYEGQNIHTFGSFDHLGESFFRTIQKSALRVKIVAGASGEDQLRKYQDLDSLLVCFLHGSNDLLCVIVRICDPDHGGRSCHFYKTMFHFFISYYIRLWILRFHLSAR